MFQSLFAQINMHSRSLKRLYSGIFLVLFAIILVGIYVNHLYQSEQSSGIAEKRVATSDLEKTLVPERFGSRTKLTNSISDRVYPEAVVPGEIVGTISLTGKPPAETALPLTQECISLIIHEGKTRRYRVAANGALADVFVYISSGLGLNNSDYVPPGNPAILELKGCEYKPYILGLQTGQRLLVHNGDPFLHNVRCIPRHEKNNAMDLDFALRPGANDFEFRFEQPEPFIQFRSGTHYWMFAYVFVVDHPFFDVSSEDGTFMIPQVPPGRYLLTADHRKAGRITNEVVIAPGETASIDFMFEVPERSRSSREAVPSEN